MRRKTARWRSQFVESKIHHPSDDNEKLLAYDESTVMCRVHIADGQAEPGLYGQSANSWIGEGCGFQTNPQFTNRKENWLMRPVVSAQGNNLDAPASPVFGRCPTYLFVDTETVQFEAVPNPAISQAGAAGIQAAQFVVKQGAEAVHRTMNRR